MESSFEAFASEDLLGFYRELLGTASPPTPVALVPPSREELEAWHAGVPLLRLPVVRVDGRAFSDLALKVAEICAAHFPGVVAEADLENTLRELVARPDEGEGLLADLISGEVPSRLGPDLNPGARQALGLVLGHALKLAVRGLWEQASGWLDATRWRRGFCPMCGGPPSMGLVDAGGGYHLYCGLCEARWPLDGGCPFCGEEAWEPVPESGDRGCILYSCRRCQGYLKTVDARQAGADVDLFWEDLKTLDLDLAAWRRGLVSGAILAGLKAREGGGEKTGSGERP
ncbi:MAG: formate dehydrogenase accessory protein FdhE [Clostridia bacterium]|nr:formate dehydrogenase accessory protein FdhE [Clostridia bacterium]MDH7572861.1 formate dehydrogenase accessory protein FdhE [Clostridia bacterium]